MSSYAYVAVDPAGTETRGILEVADQSEALRRIKEMGLFPTRISENRRRRASTSFRTRAVPGKRLTFSLPLARRVN